MRLQNLARLFILTNLILFFSLSELFAGGKVKIDDEAYVDVGLRVQTYLEADKKGADLTDRHTSLKRTRFRTKLVANSVWSAFIQTDLNSKSTTANTVKAIDAFITAKFNPLFTVMVGEFLTPSSRQDITSSAALMAIDRPDIKSAGLTWDAMGSVSPTYKARDVGINIMGYKSLNKIMHVKYYVGVYDGVPYSGDQNSIAERVTGRVTFNLFDAEKGYFYKSTYLGKKKTVALGVSYDMQSRIAENDTSQKAGSTALDWDKSQENIDYKQLSVDLFVEIMNISLEGGFTQLDLGGAEWAYNGSYSDAVSNSSFKNFKESEGNGYYVQVGYLIMDKIQPWLMFNQWNTDATGGAGGFVAYRAGVSYFFKGHNANIKLGWYRKNAKGESITDSYILGFFMNY